MGAPVVRNGRAAGWLGDEQSPGAAMGAGAWRDLGPGNSGIRQMNVTFACPRCEKSGRVEIAPEAGGIKCPHCGLALETPEGAVAGGEVRRCLVCPSTDLFVRKDFPQWLGVTIVVVGFAVSCVTWYHYWVYATFAVLFATALADVVLYLVMGEALVCYRCGAEYRGTAGLDKHGGFNLETHERYRQLKARLAEPSASPRHTASSR